MFRNPRNILLGILFGLLIWLTAMFVKILMLSDITVEPISPQDNPDFNATGFTQRPPVYLISYAAGKEMWFKNQNALAHSALNKGIDFILNYKASHLDPEFVTKNKATLSQKTGGGYWIWKPHLILKTLKMVPEGAIIIYSDSANIFRGSWIQLLEKAKTNDILFFKYFQWSNGLLERSVKRYALIKTGCDTEECRQAPHLWAGFMIIRNTPTSRAFIQKWLEYCEDPTLVMEEPTVLSEYPDYAYHQHDEALLCITHHQMSKGMLALSPREFEFLEGRTRKPRDEYKSMLPVLHKGIRGMKAKIFNSYPMIKLREFFLPRYFTNHFEAKKPRKD